MVVHLQVVTSVPDSTPRGTEHEFKGVKYTDQLGKLEEKPSREVCSMGQVRHSSDDVASRILGLEDC